MSLGGAGVGSRISDLDLLLVVGGAAGGGREEDEGILKWRELDSTPRGCTISTPRGIDLSRNLDARQTKFGESENGALGRRGEARGARGRTIRCI